MIILCFSFLFCNFVLENKENMNKLFRRQIGIASVLYIAILALLSFYFFWQRTGWNILFGIILLLLAAISIERLLHTTYTLTEDGKLAIDSGRGSRRKTIAIEKIIRVTPHRVLFGFSKYLLVEYGNGKLLPIQPDNETLFLEELKKRQHETT